jgi:hypothetical protein
VLEISAADGRLIAVKRDLQDPFHKWRGRGRLPGGLAVDAYLQRARG